MEPLLIHADPGARAHFVASWLKSELLIAEYDVGLKIKTSFTKLHTDWNNVFAKEFNGTKIRIKPSFFMLPIHLHLFLIKNVYTQIPNFPRDGFGFTTVEKLLETIKTWWYHDKQVDVSLYNKIINFSDTYNNDYMIELFKYYNDRYPSDQQISILKQTNILNFPNIDRNSACSVASMVIEQEYTNGFKEIDRYWSLQHIYKNTDTQHLYDTVYKSIIPENYGISDLHEIGINKNLLERKHDI